MQMFHLFPFFHPLLCRSTREHLGRKSDDTTGHAKCLHYYYYYCLLLTVAPSPVLCEDLPVFFHMWCVYTYCICVVCELRYGETSTSETLHHQLVTIILIHYTMRSVSHFPFLRPPTFPPIPIPVPFPHKSAVLSHLHSWL